MTENSAGDKNGEPMVAMSATYRCDRCGGKMKQSDHFRVRLKLGNFAVEVMHSNDGILNAGQVCHKCVREIVAKGKAMPK